MLSLLIKWIFPPAKHDHRAPKTRAGIGMLCGVVGIVLNLLLSAAKFFAGALSGSIAITADAYNNLCDAGSSLLSLVGFKLSAQEPDTGHPFGHGRFEYVFGLFIAMGILLAGYSLFRESLEQLLSPEAGAVFQTVSFVVLGASILVKLYMAFYNRRIGKRIGSASMRAVAADSLCDVIATSVVLVCAILSKLYGWQLDAWCGMAVAGFIAFTALKAAKETISPLLGQAPDKELIEEITGLVLSYPQILAVHDMIIHDYGPGRLIISLHAEVSADGDMLELHDVVDNAERALRQKLHCNATIHMDPVATHDDETLALRGQCATFAAELDPRASIHDFRVVTGPTHTNLIFDIVVPHKFRLRDAEIKFFLQSRVATLGENYFTVVDVDKNFV
ncbi:MAG: cation diffusion facilitator family transporter [Clostridiales bacterium]|nr:cation diffusion facilitator family transporter [Clostridiales bacterium]